MPLELMPKREYYNVFCETPLPKRKPKENKLYPKRGNFNNEIASHMCQYGSCRESWFWKRNGMGNKKYCVKHSKIVRLTQQREFDAFRRALKIEVDRID